VGGDINTISPLPPKILYFESCKYYLALGMSVFGGDGKKACSKTGKIVLEGLCIKNSGHKRLFLINLVTETKNIQKK